MGRNCRLGTQVGERHNVATGGGAQRSGIDPCTGRLTPGPAFAMSRHRPKPLAIRDDSSVLGAGPSAVTAVSHPMRFETLRLRDTSEHRLRADWRLDTRGAQELLPHSARCVTPFAAIGKASTQRMRFRW